LNKISKVFSAFSKLGNFLSLLNFSLGFGFPLSASNQKLKDIRYNRLFGDKHKKDQEGSICQNYPVRIVQQMK